MESSYKLQGLRAKISELDRMIVHMLFTRFLLVEEVAAWKEKNHVLVEDPGRDKEVIGNVQGEAQRLGLNLDFVTDLWSRIIDFAKHLQYRRRTLGSA